LGRRRRRRNEDVGGVVLLRSIGRKVKGKRGKLGETDSAVVQFNVEEKANGVGKKEKAFNIHLLKIQRRITRMGGYQKTQERRDLSNIDLVGLLS